MPSGKILVVDDEPIITGLISQVLGNEGYQVFASNSPTEGLSLVETEGPDMILLDIGMPEMDGYEFCRHLQERGVMDETPVIFLSGKTAEEDGGRAFQMGAATYIRKPFSNTTLKEIVSLTMSSLGKM